MTEFYKNRIFFCTESKATGKSACAVRGCAQTLQVLEAELKKRGLNFDVKVTTTSCLGLCERGPNCIVAPQGTWYSGLTPEMVSEFVETQIVQGKRFEKLACDEAELQNFFDEKVARKKRESAQN